MVFLTNDNLRHELLTAPALPRLKVGVTIL